MITITRTEDELDDTMGEDRGHHAQKVGAAVYIVR